MDYSHVTQRGKKQTSLNKFGMVVVVFWEFYGGKDGMGTCHKSTFNIKRMKTALLPFKK